jgi:NADPH-dependent ferric siderophore reductase
MTLPMNSQTKPEAEFGARHQITRVRHELRRRRLTVSNVERLTPRMQRITFSSPELRDFTSAAADDHVKLFFPGGPGAETCMRDYTPRRFDAPQNSLTIDFALHEAGPATAWALAAKVGDALEIGGPRGSTVVPDDFDWYLLIGDETALPAIGRRVEDLRPGVPVKTVAVVERAEERQAFHGDADLQSYWIAREGQALDDAALLRFALDEVTLPPGDGFVWIAAEANTARTLRSYFMEARGHPKSWIKASGYWSRGAAAFHETFQEG